MSLLIQYTLLFASVLALVALGGCFSEHSGVINLGLEGIMVIGALGGALTMKSMDSAPAAVTVLVVLLVSALSGMAYAVLLAVACINFSADQTLVGTALNILATAAATVIVKAINMAENPDNVSATVKYVEAKKDFVVNIGSFQLIAVLTKDSTSSTRWLEITTAVSGLITEITAFMTASRATRSMPFSGSSSR